ncbi:ABC transporter permease [Stackebrandtia soli]|uniref:ABC transporter permease n=1 Tax=Stackebrandtia soli TaxID=1892856 RepID=UPI0039EC297E
MNLDWTPIRAGINRGGILVKQSLTSPSEMFGSLFPSLIAMVVMIFLRDTDVAGAGPVSLGSMMLPSLLGMNIAFSGLMGMLSVLVMERTDGTLLRAKAIPGGMTAYLLGVTLSTSAWAFVSTVIVMVPGLLIFDNVALASVGSWVTLLLVVIVGLLATMPLGAVLGATISNPRNMGLAMLPMMGLIAISGIFYPIAALPGWLQWIGQVFPIYWLGLGMRSAMLPDAMSAVEVAGSWRSAETFLVLGVWAILGLGLAPVMLRRMARRESGSSVAARRAKMMENMP